jgi:flagellar basal body-associated protein FliL
VIAKLGKTKLALLAVAVIVVAGAAYKLVLTPRAKPGPKKIDGALVSLGDPFTVNLSGGHYGRITVAVLLASPPPAVVDPSTMPPLPEYDAVRAIVTDHLTGIDPGRLTDRSARHKLLAQLLLDLKKSTDEPVKQVLFTDLAVQ